MTAQLDLLTAYEARDHALTQVEDAGDAADRSVIDQAIRHIAATGRPFTANDVRPLLPVVRAALIGARFRAAAISGLIRPTGRYVPSTDPRTHAHPVREWVRA